MKILSLANKLKKIYDTHGDVHVMIEISDRSRGPWEVHSADFLMAGEGEFPEDFNMPEGFKFVLLSN